MEHGAYQRLQGILNKKNLLKGKQLINRYAVKM